MRKKAPHSDVIETTRYPARCPACAKVKGLRCTPWDDCMRVACADCGWQAKYRLIEAEA